MKGTRFLIDDKRNTALLRVWEKNLKQYWKKNLNYAESKVSLFLGTQKHDEKIYNMSFNFYSEWNSEIINGK